MVSTITYKDEFREQTIELIKKILNVEFGCEIDLNSKDKDLHDNNIFEIYQKNKGNFWLAVLDKKVIGTIALRNFNNGRGYLKRMYIENKSLDDRKVV